MSAMMGDVGLTGTLIEGSIGLKHRQFGERVGANRMRQQLLAKYLLGKYSFEMKSLRDQHIARLRSVLSIARRLSSRAGTDAGGRNAC
jgi:hypothetical protein